MPQAELRAAIAKVDAAVEAASERAGDALTCRRGCARCCVAGLSVLPVEAALISAVVRERALPLPGTTTPGMCAFLDAHGDCAIYPARPVVCRTHGLALRTVPDPARTGAVPVLGDDIEVCRLNYTTRAPAPAEILDATRILMLLVTVDRRYRARVGLPDDGSRVELAALAAELRAR